ncbi:MAG: hypothetical protein O3A21_00410 [Proteobacteria bacterium]|nr:hypothetical protein [Pseudomonadota bacterium]
MTAVDGASSCTGSDSRNHDQRRFLEPGGTHPNALACALMKVSTVDVVDATLGNVARIDPAVSATR